MGNQIIVGAFIIIISCSAGYLIAIWRNRWAELIKRVAKLEQQSPRRHTHNTAAGIEDTIACAIDVLINLDADMARVQTLMNKLQTMREGPYAYDPEQEAGLRK